MSELASRRPRARGRGLALAWSVALLAVPSAAAPAGDAPQPPALDTAAEPRRIDAEFACGEARCAAWLYLPPGAAIAPPPVVVMAHGFGGTRHLFLPAYAEQLARRGLAVFVFDYRSFGDSGGEPRQIVRIEDQLEDWRAALRHVRTRDDVDARRLGLWGTSLSGGHVVVIAAEDAGVRASVAQVPYIDGDAGQPAPLGFRLRALWAIARDYGRALLGRRPYYVPVLAPPDRFGAINTPDALAAMQRLIPASLDWTNEVAARSLLELASYRPVVRAAGLASPVLLMPAREDTLIPLATVRSFAESLPRAEVSVLEGGHFDSYGGPARERAAELQADFLWRHLAADPTRN